MISNFEIIGKVYSNVLDEIKKNYPNIEWYKIKGMRDFMSYEYFRVRPEIIWDSALQIIPILNL